MMQSFDVAELVPHSGTMSLLDEILAYGDDWLRAAVDIRADSLFCEDGAVPAWVGLEYMAQTIAAFAGMKEVQAGGKPRLGFLVGTRRYNSNIDRFCVGTRLEIQVTRDLEADNGLSVFDCQITAAGIEVQAGLNVYQPDDAIGYIQESSR